MNVEAGVVEGLDGPVLGVSLLALRTVGGGSGGGGWGWRRGGSWEGRVGGKGRVQPGVIDIKLPQEEEQ